jgi:prevent-host-death family protein
MQTVGVRELRTHMSRILREVAERGEAVEVTRRGRAVARMIPIAASTSTVPEADPVWSDLDRLAAEIAARWASEVTAVDAVREGRRDL